MAKNSTIFITYNPRSRDEETLAVRLHSIGAVNGFTAYLPDRFNSITRVDRETKVRIQESDYFVMFALDAVSPLVQQEIELAKVHFKDSSKIFIIHKKNDLSKVKQAAISGVTYIDFDPLTQTVDTVIQSILKKIQSREVRQTQNTQNENGIIALIGIGLGLLALSALFNSDD